MMMDSSQPEQDKTKQNKTPHQAGRYYVTLFLGKTVLFNFVFSRRYVAKMTGKSVFSDKITGKKGGLFCR
jgi:hypothetical protein